MPLYISGSFVQQDIPFRRMAPKEVGASEGALQDGRASVSLRPGVGGAESAPFVFLGLDFPFLKGLRTASSLCSVRRWEPPPNELFSLGEACCC